MKILTVNNNGKITKYQTREYCEEERDWVDDIVFGNGVWIVYFSHYKDPFKAFQNMPCEYKEFHEDEKSNIGTLTRSTVKKTIKNFWKK